MSDNPLRDLLNDRRWNHGDLDRVWLDTVHRGAPDDRRRIPSHAIRDIGGAGLHLDPPEVGIDEEEPEEETGADGMHLPWHRVLAVWVDDTLLWSRT